MQENASSASESGNPFPAPPPQQNYQVAVDKAVEALRSQSAEQLAWLGATGEGKLWQLPALEDVLTVDPASGKMTVSDGNECHRSWQIIVLHYLAVSTRPESRSPETTFADLPGGRSYNKVHRGRVIGRLCGTAGRDEKTLRGAAEKLGTQWVQAGDLAFDLRVFPRVPIRLIWHAADDEFPPSATFLLPGNIESFLCIEDIVVLSECIVSRLCGRPF